MGCFDWIDDAVVCQQVLPVVAKAVLDQQCYQLCMGALTGNAFLVQIYDGKDGKEKYPRRWVMLPPFY